MDRPLLPEGPKPEGDPKASRRATNRFYARLGWALHVSTWIFGILLILFYHEIFRLFFPRDDFVHPRNANAIFVKTFAEVIGVAFIASLFTSFLAFFAFLFVSFSKTLRNHGGLITLLLALIAWAIGLGFGLAIASGLVDPATWA